MEGLSSLEAAAEGSMWSRRRPGHGPISRDELDRGPRDGPSSGSLVLAPNLCGAGRPWASPQRDGEVDGASAIR